MGKLFYEERFLMKKGIVLFIISIILAGCQLTIGTQDNDDNNISEKKEEEIENKINEEESVEEALNKDMVSEKKVEKDKDDAQAKTDRENDHSTEPIEENHQEAVKDSSSLGEIPTIQNVIEQNDFDYDVVEDNNYKRVLLIKDDHGHKSHKSIFLKKSNHLKVIKFDHGQIFNGHI